MKILIKKISTEKFEVSVSSSQTTKHFVTIEDETYFKLTKRLLGREELIEHSFKFLLEREPSSSILSEFELSKISNFFPEFDKFIEKLISDKNFRKN